MKPFVYTLSVQDWSACIDGEHLTCKIEFEKESKTEEVELERPISVKEADYLAKKEGLPGWYSKQPRISNKFNTYAEVEKYATKWCKDHAKDKTDWILIYNDYHNPNVPIAGGGNIVNNFPVMKELAEQWDKVSNAQREEPEPWNSVYKAWKALCEIPT